MRLATFLTAAALISAAGCGGDPSAPQDAGRPDVAPADVRPLDADRAEGGEGCVPLTCAAASAGCGIISDGCDGTLDCGGCTAPATCGGSGQPNQCGCTPTTCAQLGSECGQELDGCGGVLSCGGCPAPQVCAASGPANTCTDQPCSPETCASLSAECGSVSDGCGKVLSCGGCTAPETCGGGGTSNVCGCTAQTDAQLCVAEGVVCGPLTAEDSCGVTRTIASCGGCSAPETCGGGGTPSVCGCTAESDADLCLALSSSCGATTGMDSCGVTRTIQCGSCPAVPNGSATCQSGACVTTCNAGHVACAQGCCPAAPAPTGAIEQLNDVGRWVSIAVDGSDRPHLAYVDSTSRAVVHRTWDGTAWQRTVLATGENPADVTVRLDSQDRPHVAWEGTVFRQLAYRRWNGASWDPVKAISGGAACPRMALDANDVPFFAFTFCPTGCSLMKVNVRSEPASAFGGVVHEVDYGHALTIAMDPLGQPAVGYEDLSTLRHADWAGTAFAEEVVAGDSDSARLLFDAAGAAIYVFQDAGGWPSFDGDLRIARRAAGGGWTVTDIDTASDVGYLDAALDAAGNIHVAYDDRAADDLRRAFFDGVSWTTTIVDAAGDVGNFVALDVDSQNRAHIGYYDQSNGDLKYAVVP